MADSLANGRNDQDLPMADTHHHLWDLGRFRYDWLSGDGDPAVTAFLGPYDDIRRDYLVDQLRRDYSIAGIVKSVHVQADVSVDDPIEETVWLQSIADEHGFPQGIVAFSDLRRPDVRAELERHCEAPNMRGIRMPDEAGLLGSPAFRAGASVLHELGLSFQVDPIPERHSDLAALADAIPDLQIFVGHTGVPEDRNPDYFERWRASLGDLAKRPNVVVKISGLGMGDHRWTVESIRPWVLSAIEIFGVDRCVFGTNWPVDRLYSSIEALAAAYRAIVGDLDPGEQRALLLGNAERLYRI